VSSRRHNHVCMVGLAAFCCLTFASLAPARALAFADSPAWTVSAIARPTDFVAGDHGGNDFYEVTVTNTGDAPSNGSTVTITDTLPAGLAPAAGVSGTELLAAAPLSCAGLTCTYSGIVAAGDTLTIRIPVNVESFTSSGETNVVNVVGGGASEASVTTPVMTSSVFPGFGIAPGSFLTTLASTQAGAHADLTTSFSLNTNAEGGAGGNTKDTVVDLPVGFAGDPAATPTCTETQLEGKLREIGGLLSACPLNSQVGTITFVAGFLPESGPPFIHFPITAPIYNMQPLGGEVTRLGFDVIGITTNIVISVLPGYGLQATAPNLVSGDLEVDSAKLTVWGVPADPSHDLLRGTACEAGECEGPNEFPVGSNKFPVGEGVAATIPAEPFLSNPTQCTQSSMTAMIRLDTWQHRELPTDPSAEASLGPMTGCERLGFNPSITVQPTSVLAETATGLNVGVTLPQTYGNPTALATSHLKNAVVTLPQGMTVNPSAGEGLGACTPAQYEAEALEIAPGNGCPNDSSLGTVTIHTPVLKEEATGSVYLATPYDNPFPEEDHPNGSLIAIYVVARIPDRGVIVKIAGRVTPNPVTGQLVTTFEDNPQLPFDKFTLSFRPGQAAPLVTPPACGAYAGQGAFTSWSEPEQILTSLTPPFNVTQGVGGGACPSGGVPPFDPQVRAGSFNAAAGSYSPFYLRITRNDGEQELTRFSTVLPPGMSGDLSGIPFCPEADIEAAKGVSGAQETGEPSCPAASEIGHTLVGAGVGGVLAQAPGKVYLAGPYHGAPLSVVSITSATVGPFDLGTVVIRFALRINPSTAQVEVSSAGSDPIPHIIRGIVTHVRDIRVWIDRPNFTLNPTDCTPMSIAATVTGAGADFTNPVDQVPVTVTDPFQVANCATLAFKPSFKVSTSGHTSRMNGASLTVKLTYPNTPQGTEANIARVKVELPKQLPSRLTTLQKACTAATFEANPANCPVASVVGHAKAVTPILPVPLEGPAYFVSHGGEAFPSLIIVLQGYGVTVDLVGATFISKHGITSSTFKTVPDVPVGSFQLTLPEGPTSALAAPANLCQGKLTMPTEFVAQNGATLSQNTHIEVEGCSNTLSVVSTHVHKRAVVFVVYVPGAGKLAVSGRGVGKASKSAAGREDVTVTLHASRGGKAKIKLSFSPRSGKHQTKTITVKLGR
jgi:uncharacterized repeat protein (TIGR01451 family)